MSETKAEVRARIDELRKLREFWSTPGDDASAAEAAADELARGVIDRRVRELEAQLETAEEDLMASVIRSHKAICEAKKMGEKDAYGNDPAVYYTLGVCGEAGEMANAIVKAQRNGADPALVLAAVKSELPDVIIYSYVLAHVLDIDLTALVNEKVEIVVQRALDGYYGGELRK
jgi:NTP pyrophosphatase (non-canonical NTP hydrolase)